MPEVGYIADQGEREVMAFGVKGADESVRNAFDDGRQVQSQSLGAGVLHGAGNGNAQASAIEVESQS